VGIQTFSRIYPMPMCYELSKLCFFFSSTTIFITSLYDELQNALRHQMHHQTFDISIDHLQSNSLNITFSWLSLMILMAQMLVHAMVNVTFLWEHGTKNNNKKWVDARLNGSFVEDQNSLKVHFLVSN
jgi:hypothetical protein